MKLHVEVTQEDIDQGKRCNARGCMVHRAFMRATEGAFRDVQVSPAGICIDQGVTDLRLPHEVSLKIAYWDFGDKPESFAFDLELPDSLFEVQS